MKITPELKQEVVTALERDMIQRGSKSQAEYSRYIKHLLNIPFDTSAFSTIKKVDGRSAIKDTSWLKLAYHFGLMRNDWQTAQTATFNTIQVAMELCQENGIWQVLCDRNGIGKSYAARAYAEAHKDSVIYIDCSQHTTLVSFIAAVGRQVGVPMKRTYSEQWELITDTLILMEKPLLVLDELGDVDDRVITLLKGLYNKADNGGTMELGFYGMGADNLQQRLENGRLYKKRSYAEFWSRFDNQTTALNFKNDPQSYLLELREELEAIIDANLPKEILEQRTFIIKKCLQTMGVRSVKKEIALQLKIYNKTQPKNGQLQ